jgi:HAD superfamily hydrolase (TIGR01509 family)
MNPPSRPFRKDQISLPDSMPPIHAVLFDFAGTLFTPRPAAEWVEGAARDLDVEMTRDDIERLAQRCLAAGLPGGPYPDTVPDHVVAAYAARDLNPAAHRAAYVELLRGATQGWPGLADAIYERVLDPVTWLPYSDARPVVDALVARKIRVGLISNVAFDLRPILRHHGFSELADRSTLSFEQHVTKPDPRIFRAALRTLGAEPAETLMVGDHPEADGAAAELGLRTLIWPMSPPGAEHGLDRVLRVVGLPPSRP